MSYRHNFLVYNLKCVINVFLTFLRHKRLSRPTCLPGGQSSAKIGSTLMGILKHLRMSRDVLVNNVKTF